MSFHIDFYPTKEEVFQKSDEECLEIVKELRATEDTYLDPDFPPTSKSQGNFKDNNDKVVKHPRFCWLPPHLLKEVQYRSFGCFLDEWRLWEDPWPHHVCQGVAGDCWLLASLMTICKRRELMEQIVPRNEYSMEQGLVQVRLLIDGQWQVFRLDYYIPNFNGVEQCVIMPRKQTWAAFIEKAFAKNRGSYGGLHGGLSSQALHILTGAITKMVWIHGKTDEDQLWEDMIKYYSAGFLMTAATPELKEGTEEWEFFEKHSIERCHEYSILDFKEHQDHRLIQIGNPNIRPWKGNFASMKSYEFDEDDLENLAFVDFYLSDMKIFWMELKDFHRFFSYFSVCHYREGWHEKRLRQRVNRMKGQDFQIIRIDVKEKCEMAIEVFAKRCTWRYENIFLNLHRCCPNSQEPGELLYTAHDFHEQITFDESLELQPGSYFVIVVFVEGMKKLDLDWVFRSSKSLESFSLSFHICPFSTVLKSAQSIFLIYGKVDHRVEDQVIVYTWHGEKGNFVMVDNLRAEDYCRFSGSIDRDYTKKVRKFMFYNYSQVVPPRSRMIVGYISYRQDEGYWKGVIAIKYSIGNRYLQWLDRLDYWTCLSEIEYCTKL
ncbi:hypothetical protein B9Z55_008731 [Caenorhabditis nigoni]|uniref:Calpain catalytic domain-containing protein n=2 Tax=Caenorhabditis nigoni TaxID=1611254 RepID=A0A2G5UNV4_9PELO|nr:hypothetical protein B9Z55_008731 [Caenorhabditis nigoni]